VFPRGAAQKYRSLRYQLNDIRARARGRDDDSNGLPYEHLSQSARISALHVEDFGVWIEIDRALPQSSRVGELGPATRYSVVEQFSAPPPSSAAPRGITLR
jgi:hypothetical protein